MSLTALNTSTSPSLDSDKTSIRERISTVAAGVDKTLDGVASKVADGASATVSFSGAALKALESVGSGAVDAIESGAVDLAHGAEDLAVGTWHAIKNTAVGAAQLAETAWDDVSAGASTLEKLGAAVVNTVETDVGDMVSAAKSGAKELGSAVSSTYDTVSNAASSVTSTAVFAAAAGAKTLQALI